MTTPMRTRTERKHKGRWLPEGMVVSIIQLTGTGNSTGPAVRDGRVSDGLWVRVTYPNHVAYEQARFPTELAALALRESEDPEQAVKDAARVTTWLRMVLRRMGIDIADLEDVPVPALARKAL